MRVIGKYDGKHSTCKLPTGNLTETHNVTTNIIEVYDIFCNKSSGIASGDADSSVTGEDIPEAELAAEALADITSTELDGSDPLVEAQAADSLDGASVDGDATDDDDVGEVAVAGLAGEAGDWGDKAADAAGEALDDVDYDEGEDPDDNDDEGEEDDA